MTNKIYDVIIVGGGPAGLSSALYTSRANLSVALFEKEITCARLYETEHIDNYLGAFSTNASELANKMSEDALKFGADIFTFTKVNKITKEADYYKIEVSDIVDSDNKEFYYSKAVLLATGTEHNHLLLDRHDELLGNGISYCATCDGAFYKDSEVAVVGGGDSAMESALLLSEYANKVYLLVRNKIRAKAHLWKLVKEKENIEVIYNEIDKLLIDNEKLTGVKLNNGKIINIQGLFPAIGVSPNTNYIDTLYLRNIDNYNDYLLPKVTNSNNLTYHNGEGLFIAGDLKNPKYRQVAIAVGEGAYAALEVYDYLKGL